MKAWRFSKVIQISKEGISIQQVDKLLQLADEHNDVGLSSLEKWPNAL
jgi:hypothetical protein